MVFTILITTFFILSEGFLNLELFSLIRKDIFLYLMAVLLAVGFVWLGFFLEYFQSFFFKHRGLLGN